MKASDIPEDVRAEMDGNGAEPQTFNAWVKEQTPEELARLFGRGPASRWGSGKITQVELLRQTGNALALKKFASANA